MAGIGLCFGVAIGALENRIVVGVGVARRAHAVGSAVIHRPPGVIKRRTQPVRGDPSGVAGDARRWETSGRVVRIRRPQIVRFVAGVAIRRGAGKYSADVALAAGDLCMRTLQREWGVVVVKRCVQPRRRRVAHGAILRESAGDVIGNTGHVRSVVVVLLVAADACGRERPLVIVCVASGARDIHVRAGEGERGGAVVELGIEPR